jgi:hypothetical protein
MRIICAGVILVAVAIELFTQISGRHAASIYAQHSDANTLRSLCSSSTGSEGSALFFNDSFAVVSNGYVCGVFSFVRPSLAFLAADPAGSANYGTNALAGDGVSIEVQGASGQISSSVNTGACARSMGLTIVSNTSQLVSITIHNIGDSCPNGTVFEDWTLSLAQGSPKLVLAASGVTTQNTYATVIRRAVAMKGSSIYAFFERGVVQMRDNQNELASIYPSADTVGRVYSLGGCCDPLHSAGNVSLSIVRTPTNCTFSGSSPNVAIVSNDLSFASYYTAFHDNIVADPKQVLLDMWGAGWLIAPRRNIPAGVTWQSSMSLAPNAYDFPTLPGSVLPEGQWHKLANIPTADLHAMLTGIFASIVGNLFTHDNEVQPGYRVGQIATTIHRPDVGYSNTYNYFDPDNYFGTFALLSSNDDYLQHEVQRVLERSGDFLNSKGQLPHHFVGVVPTYQALSGATQTGPNVFWILSCLNYVKYSGDIAWLEKYMPTLRNASSFLFDMIDPQMHLLKCPGSLYIDVFIRNNFTADSNGMIVGFFQEFADAEALLGNESGATLLRGLSEQVAAAMNTALLANTSDHYVTQRNPDGTIRDFVDYDANLISLAHGVPVSSGLAQRIMSRIDGGRCTRGRATFVSEKYYGPQDCTNGNIGDSWCAMGRNGWFDALTRKRFMDLATFNNLILDPLIGDVRRWTWLWERYACDGTPQLNRTVAYFEYPAVTSIMISYIRYGIQPGLQAFTIDPFLPNPVDENTNFSFSVGHTVVQFSQAMLQLKLPKVTTTDGSMTRNLTVTQLTPATGYSITTSGCINPMPPFQVITSTTGILVATVQVNDKTLSQCVISIVRM